MCWARPERGERCEDCLWALARHPSAAIRRQLVAEPDLPVDALELLATDFDATVQAHAVKALGSLATGGPVLPADLLADDRAGGGSAGGFDLGDFDYEEGYYEDRYEDDEDLEPVAFGRWAASDEPLPTGSGDRS